MSKKTWLFIIVSCCCFTAFAQKNRTITPKKYPSILWEIKSKNSTKPSYLFGTMHVSSKLVFNLSDSFYNAIKRCDATAIEIDPLSWQDEFENSIMNKMYNASDGLSSNLSSNYITKNSFLLTDDDESYKAALSLDPAIINQFLYRNYQGASDFEENTYIDMHIFQCAKKLKKYFYPLENFKESEELMLKGYKAQAGTKRKEKSRSEELDEDEIKKSKRGYEGFEEAYRNEDLDLLDSLNSSEVYNEVFNEYFLIERNRIQANGIDSIIKKGQTVFAAVGAAHLPGNRGVIEFLRQKGYTLRPIFMGIKVSKQRDEINKIKLPVTFINQKANDNLFTVDVPGKLYNFKSTMGFFENQYIHADFDNGTYYSITRVPTNTKLWGKTTDNVYKKIDSILYEYIPGKILERSSIINNGFKGYNIVNKTKKGDVQRYNIFVTPLELVVFKMSGFEDYVKGIEANTFFSSIKMNAQKNNWNLFSPTEKGFEMLLPNMPNKAESNGSSRSYYGGSNSNSYEAYDDKKDIYVFITKKDIKNYNFLEEDTFMLSLANESIYSSALFDSAYTREFGKQNNLTYLQTTGKLNNLLQHKYINRLYLIGNEIYNVLISYKADDDIINKALNSFSYKEFGYAKSNEYIDTALHFKVKSALAPDSLTQIFLSINELQNKTRMADIKTKKTEAPYYTEPKVVVFKSDSTDEEIMVKSRVFEKYYYLTETTDFWKEQINELNERLDNNDMEFNVDDENFLENLLKQNKKEVQYDFYVKEKKVDTIGKQIICNVLLADTNSSQMFKIKMILCGNRLLTVGTTCSNIVSLSKAKQDFFETFTAYNVDNNYSITNSKTNLFFDDFSSKDTTRSKFAKRNKDAVSFKTNDIENMVNAIKQLNPKSKDYFKLKSFFISEIGKLKTTDTSVAALLKIYDEVGDTATFQNEVLVTLSSCLRQDVYNRIGKIISTDPPIFDDLTDAYTMFEHFNDSLKLTKTILPQITKLANLDDYKTKVYDLLSLLVDSNLIIKDDYKNLYEKIFFDAKIAYKKLKAADEKLMNQNNLKEDDDESKSYDYDDYMPSIYSKNSQPYVDLISASNNIKSYLSKGNYNSDADTKNIESYYSLLMPYYNKDDATTQLINNLLQLKNNSTKFSVASSLIKYKLPIADSFFNSIATDDKTRLSFIRWTLSKKKLNLIPKNYFNQSKICLDILKNDDNSKKDSLEYLNVYLPLTLKNKEGNVHFFKYKSSEKDVDWNIAYCGFQPFDTTTISTNSLMCVYSDKVLKTNKTIMEQAQKIIKEIVYRKRKSSSEFYDENSYGNRNYRGFRRYRD